MVYLITIIFLIFWVLSLLGFGSLFQFIFNKSTLPSEIRFSLSGILGLVFVYLIGTILNLFLPLNLIISIIILASGLLIFFINFKKIISLLDKKEWYILLLILLFLSVIPFRFELYSDTGLYHFQAIKWISNYRIPFGLANLHTRFGFNSSWFLIEAVLEKPSLLFKAPFFITNPIILFFYGINIFFSLRKFINGERTFSGIFMIATIIPWMFKIFNTMSSSLSPDLPAAFITLLFIYFTIIIFEKNEDYDLIFLILTILSAFTLTVKISSVPLIFGTILLLLFFYFKVSKKIFSRKFIITIISAAFIILIPWLIYGILLSGYLIYPISFTRINRISWAVPVEKANTDVWSIKNWARNPGLKPEKFFTGFSWIKPWFLNFLKFNKIFTATFFMTILLSIVLLFKRNHELNKKKVFIFPLIISITGMIFWFITAPEIRFGFGIVSGFLLLLLSIPIYFIKIDNTFLKNKINKKYLAKIKPVILIISILIILFCFFIIIYPASMEFIIKFLSALRGHFVQIDWYYRVTAILSFLLVLACILTFKLIKPKIIKIISVLFFVVIITLLSNMSYVDYYRYICGWYKITKMPEARLDVNKNEDGYIFYIPEGKDQCWDAPLPATPDFSKDLKAVYKNGNPVMFYFK